MSTLEVHMAPVKAVYGFRIKPGRFEEWRTLSREGEKLATRLGAGQVRSMMPTAAGAATPICYSTIDFPNGEAWGTFLDKSGREIESQVFVDRMFGHLDSPAELIYTGTMSEIPLESTPDTMQNGPVIETFVTRPKPGRMLDAVQFGADIAPLILEEGARAVHLYLVGASGTDSGAHAFSVEFADFAGLGRMQDASTQPKWLDVLQRAYAEDAPFVMLQHFVMNEVLMH